MDITSDAAKMRLAAFLLEGESQVWWDWVKTSKDLEAMTWAMFHGLFMSKYFSAKAQEFLKLKQRTTTVMEYVARFSELACFGDDYVATDMAKVRRFENGLKLSIRGKIVGLRLQDMDSMVGTTLAIERQRWRMHGAFVMRVPVGRGRRISLLRVLERDRGLMFHESPRY